jgi:hypothetical protein
VELNSLGGQNSKWLLMRLRVITSPPVLQAPKSGVPFRLYIAAEPSVFGAVLTQETDGKEYIVAYESRRLLDAKKVHLY